MSVCTDCAVCSQCSMKWLVGTSSTSYRSTSIFISLGHTERCYGVLLCRQMHRTRDARAVGCHSFVRRVAIYRVTSDCRACWRAATVAEIYKAFWAFLEIASPDCSRFKNQSHFFGVPRSIYVGSPFRNTSRVGGGVEINKKTAIFVLIRAEIGPTEKW
jgi:hypothetical protein